MRKKASWTRRFSVLAALVGLPVALVPFASCNLVITGDYMACDADEDCVNFKNFGCDAETHQCVTLDSCTANNECAEDEICKPISPRACVKVKQDACTQLYPDDDTYRVEGAMLVGISAPLTVDVSTGTSIVNGARLAVDEFNQEGGVGGDRPLVLVICDDRSESADAYQNGITLANIGVQAIIGPAFSGQTLDMAGTAEAPGTVANNVLLISPSATSPRVTGIQDDSPRCLASCNGDADCEDACPGLVWRTSPSDEIQGAALSEYFGEIEGRIAARGAVEPPRSSIKVWVLYKPDSYGELISEIIKNTLEFNDKGANQQQAGADPPFVRKVYEDIDPDTAGIQPDPEVIQAALDAHPDAIFIMGTNEVAEILTTIEAEWITSGGSEEDRPFYIFGDGGLSLEVSDAVRAAGAQDRVRGSIPGPKVSNIYNSFSGSYVDEFPATPGSVDGPEVFGAAGAYDTIYMLAYSSIAAGEADLTAEQLAIGFTRLNQTDGGEDIAAGPSDIGPAQSILNDGGSFNFEGASGKLDMDLSRGEAPSPIQIWCVPASGLGTNSGRYYDPDITSENKLAGEIEPPAESFACPF